VGEFEASGRDAVEVAQVTAAGFVHEGDGVRGEDVAIGTGAAHTMRDVVGGVRGAGLTEGDAGVDARAERAILAQGEPVLELGQAHQHDREQRSGVPLVIGQDVQVLEDVLVQEVRFIEQEDRVDAFFAELLHVLVDGVEDCGRGGLWRETEREANMAVEVASAERRVVAVGQAEAVSG
jgi:hypothetical protein